jgi:DNA-directed RNA polymerase specialized sigma24 family protein
MEHNLYVAPTDKFRDEDPAASGEIRNIDRECSACLYSAAHLTEEEILGAVIDNELSETEKLVVKQYWFSGKSFNTIAQTFGIPKETVRRIFEKAKQKIYNNMKYVVLYNYLIDGRKPLPEDFRFKIIRCIDGKELIA